MARKHKFTDVEKFQKMVEEYFVMCEEKKKPFTYSGLCLYLGTAKSTLTPYRQMDGFKEVLEYASLRIENFIEEGILTASINVTGGIFNLKNNYGWTDRREENVTTDGQVVFTFNRGLSDIK